MYSLKEEFKLSNVELIPPVSSSKLLEYMNQADVGLGSFGTTRKAQVCLTHKLIETLAVAKPCITGDTPAVRELLTHEKNVILCHKADSKSLAESIKRLRDDLQLREKIAENGKITFQEKCSPLVVGRKIKDIAQAIY